MTTSREQQSERARRLDGAAVAEEIKREAGEEAARLKERGVVPCLAAVLVGDDPASAVYVRNKVRACEELGLKSERHLLGAGTGAVELLSLVGQLNARDDVDGILVQLPLPPGIDEGRVLEAIDPAKDVDGFHPVNVGRLSLGQDALVPCTPAGIVELLVRARVPLRGAHACVVGRSNIGGKPVAQLLLRHAATVTVCHSRTPDLAAVTSQADVLVAAVGRPGVIRGGHVKPGAAVVDVGINKVTDEAQARELFGGEAERRVEVIRRKGYTLAGDVHPAEVSRVAGLLTPVPGGVGLLTVAMLMKNTVTAARRRRGPAA